VRYGLYHYEDGNGFQRFSIGKLVKGNPPLINFTSFDRARDYLIDLVKQHKLDPELCSLPASMMLYFGYSINTSKDQNDQKLRFKAAIQAIKDDSQSFCLIGKGREAHEKSVALVDSGKYQGFGFYDAEMSFENIDEVKRVITNYPDTPDVHRIINQFYKKRKSIVLDSTNDTWGQGLFSN
jgi:DNA polymerase-3 subunit epsilon